MSLEKVYINGFDVSALGIYVKSKHIPLAKPRTAFVDIEGGNGSLDLTGVLTDGKVTYEDRQIEVVLTEGTDPFSVRSTLVQLFGIIDYPHTLSFSEWPDYEFRGRMWIDDWSYDKSISETKIVMRAKPYAFKKDLTTKNVLLPGATGFFSFLSGSLMPVTPTFTSDRNLEIELDGVIRNLNAGVPKVFPDLIISEPYVQFNYTMDWTETRRNFALNPRQVEGGDTGMSGVRYSWSRTYGEGDGPEGINTYCRTLATGSLGTGRGFDWAGNLDVGPYTNSYWLALPVEEGVPVRLSAWTRVSRAHNVCFRWRIHDGAGRWLGNPKYEQNMSLGAGEWTRVTQDITPTATGYLTVRLELASTTGWTATDYLDQTGLYVGPPGEYFDGDSTDTAGNRYSWAGDPGTSASIEESLGNGNITIEYQEGTLL